MKTTLKFGNGIETFAHVLLVEAISQLPDQEAAKEFIVANRDKGFEVGMTVNGIDLPVVETLDILLSNFDERVKKAAVRLIEDKYDKIWPALASRVCT